jgi:myo-inositol-1(or 4)-monophosphatase
VQSRAGCRLRRRRPRRAAADKQVINPENQVSENYQELLRLTIEGAQRGAQVLREHFGKITLLQADRKGASDYVSQVDRESEMTIRDFLLRELPGSTFLGEEMGQSSAGGEYRWIVDPLDGTTNFLQGFPVFAVSVALEKCDPVRRWGDLCVGVVLHPVTGEIWTAVKGRGALKNGNPIRIGQKQDLTCALLATGYPFRAKAELKPYLKTFEELFMRSSGIRRAGAAALDLCWTADGTFDGFWEHHLSPWDIAAGALIIEEAGGIFTSFEGDSDYLTSGNVVGANPAIHALMLEVIQATVGTSPA